MEKGSVVIYQPQVESFKGDVLTDLDVTKVRWADATPEQQETMSKIVENRIPEEGVPISLDR